MLKNDGNGHRSGESDEGFVEEWRERIAALPDEQREMFEGGTLSQFFLRWPLTLSHPTFVGAFYGVLISLALLAPTLMEQTSVGESISDSARTWAITSLSIILICGILGGFSAIMVAITKRIPLRLDQKRKFIFPIPFIGLILFTASILEPTLGIPEEIGWMLMIAPGPLYVHLSYAPRWRMLDRMARGLKPIEGPLEVGKKRESEDEDLLAAIDEITDEPSD
tara:strand:- start:305 stop:973 length:669 start_codon:yes stop_codon:yes gene_type:complete